MSPRSSFTNTSGAAHSTLARTRSRSRAVSDSASSGTAKAISWNCTAAADWSPKENTYAPPASEPRRGPSRSIASAVSGIAESPNSSACVHSSASPEGQTHHTGASSTSSGWK